MIKPLAIYLALAAVASAAPPSVWDGIYTKEQAERGKKLYLESCAECHGRDLEGVDDAKPLIGDVFMKTWNAKTVGRLIDVTKRSMPPETPNSLSRQVCTDVAAYVLSMNGFPAGKTELTPGAPALKEIVIEPKK
jgi:mono/diheme cytochrome c family protein